MFAVEADWFARRLAALDSKSISPLLNIGSGSRAQREVKLPFVDQLMFAPLRERGIDIIHCDLKAEPGVDLVANVFDDRDLSRIRAAGPKAILCNSVYEHVPNLAAFAARLESVLDPGGELLVSVPHSYPYHRDPIDTLYRPSPQELADLHSSSEVVQIALIEAGTYQEAVRRNPRRIARDIKNGVRSVIDTRSTRHLYPRWWGRRYSMSCAHMRRSAT